MRCLIVLAHPVRHSLCHHLAGVAFVHTGDLASMRPPLERWPAA
ncbi:hypothetical protein [Alcaligenes sp. WGS1538]